MMISTPPDDSPGTGNAGRRALRSHPLGHRDLFNRAAVSASEVIRFGLVMTVVALGVLFLTLPYWELVGQPLTR